jgi:hypothetical protein
MNNKEILDLTTEEISEVIKFIVFHLVDDRDAVKIEEVEEGAGRILLRLFVAPEDMGKVIGKQGKIARAIRTVTKALGARSGKKVMLEIGD